MEAREVGFSSYAVSGLFKDDKMRARSLIESEHFEQSSITYMDAIFSN